MDAQTIQQQVLIGNNVTFVLRTGHILSGILIQLGRDNVVIESHGKKSTILLEMIGVCQVEEESATGDEVSTVNNHPSHSEHAEPPADKPTVLSVKAPSYQGNGTSVHAPSQTPPSNQTEAIPERQANPPDSVTPEVIKLLLAIEAKYEARIQVAKFELADIELKFPGEEIEEPQRGEARTAWQNIKSIYDYAVRVHELDPRHGRIGRFAYQLARLAEQYPDAHSLRRQAAYFSRMAGQLPTSLELWKKVATATQSSDDWKYFAAIALANQDDITCCYALGQYYVNASVDEEEAAWFIFINQIQKFSNYASLLSITQARSEFNDKEVKYLFEACMYLMKRSGLEKLAENYIDKTKNSPPSLELLIEILKQFSQEPTENYSHLATELEMMMRLCDLDTHQGSNNNDKRGQRVTGRNCKGQVTMYKDDKGYGFISGDDRVRYFFHRNSISETSLLKALNENPQSRVQVRFLAASGSRGPFAYDVETLRDVNGMFELALQYVESTEYQKGAAEMMRILNLQPDYPNGQDLLAKWQHFAAEKKLRESTLPKGDGYYSRAKCAELVEHDLERAVKLYRLAIKHKDRDESAVKDLAWVLSQLGESQEAIDILNNYRDKSKDRKAIDGVLMALYQQTGESEKAIPLLYQRARRAPNPTKRAQILWVIANLHFGRQEYDTAESIFRQVLEAQQNNTVAKRHIAICLLKQNHLDEAERILNEILEHTSDAASAEVLAAVQQARLGGTSSDIDILIATALSDFYTEISDFTKFFLDHSDYKGVPPDRIQSQDFNRFDVEKLEERAARMGSRLPRDRSGFYLSAAKIESMLEDYDPYRFSRYLCRSFASMGDAIVLESGLIESACDLYCEALAVYDNDHSRSRDEQDAANALIRVLYATLGINRIPMKANSHLSFDEALESVISQHPNHARVFSYIAYLLYRSRYAAEKILTRLYKSNWSDAALDYLRNRSVTVPGSVKDPDEFARLWDTLRRRHFDDYRVVISEFRYLMRIEIVPSTIENCINQLPPIGELLFFDLDRERVREVQRILESALELCRQTSFEDRERFCLQAESRCRALMREIESSPTKFSIEQLLPVLQSLQQKLNVWLEELYQRSSPSLSLRLAIESYSPDSERQIEVQIAIENQAGRSPAEGVELTVVQDNEQVFSLLKSDFRLNGSLRGGERPIIMVPLQLTPQALSAEAFSMTVYIQYRTRSDSEPHMVMENFPIQLTNEFNYFKNPYHAYAKGGVVYERGMFYGRDEMINSIVGTLASNPASKSIILHGQRRSGKSSILYHLKEELGKDPNVLILYIDNIGTVLEEKASAPLLYQMLWHILRQFQRSILRREEMGYSQLNLVFPTDLELYGHPAPLSYFSDLFEDFKDTIARRPDWASVRAVLLIDEFTYLYGYIMKGALSLDFMKNWKALLQRNFFSTVLAGQDVMPKFIQAFPNEFGTTEDRQVGYLDAEAARALIDEPIRIGGKSGESRYREKADDLIFELSAGNPFYIQIICSRLVENMLSKRQRLATKADVERIRDKLIRGVDALKLSDFENLINPADILPTALSATVDEDALQILKVVARNTQQVSTCARGEIVCETKKPVDEILEDLVHRSVLDCERGSFYRIRVGLFKEWLIANS